MIIVVLSLKEGTRFLIIVVLKNWFSWQSRACSVVVFTRVFGDFVPKKALGILDRRGPNPGNFTLDPRLAVRRYDDTRRLEQNRSGRNDYAFNVT